MRIYVTSVLVDDQAKALDFYTDKLGFYTDKLGFVLKRDIPLGDARWLTVTAKDEPDGTELLLEPDGHPAARPFKAALKADGIPLTSFQVGDIDAEYRRLAGLGVEFTQAPMQAGPVKMAVFDDTCGNLIQIVEIPQGAE